jgi:hypothetical protein
MIEVRDGYGMALSSPVGWVARTLSRAGLASEVSVPRVNPRWERSACPAPGPCQA